MKRLVFTLTAAVALATSAQASIILSNSFGYADGPLVSGSVGSPLGVWTTHSGTANQVDVSGGMVNLTGTEGEDVSTVLTNAAFPTAISNGTIYASFEVNFSVLPLANVYFAHFRGTGTDFRCRVFAGPSSPAGQIRIGIVNGSSTSPVFTPILLSAGTTYKIVVRFVNSAAASLWVNPSFESNAANRADGTDAASNPYAGAYNWSWRQSADMGTMTVDNLLVGTTFREVAVAPGAPVISAIPDQIIAANTSTGPLAFQVDDLETAPASLVPSGFSENTALIPNANITFGGAGSDRTVTITPAAGQQGTTRVGVVITDGSGLSTTNMVTVAVGRPTISTVANQITRLGTPFPAVPFNVNDTETPNGLSVVGYSSNQGLISDSGLQVIGTGTSRTLQITAVPGQSGACTIDLVVSDAFQSATNKFQAAVSPTLGLLVSDDFSYPDGYLQDASGYYWLGFSSGLSNDLAIASQKAVVTYTNYADCHVFFSNSVTLGANSGAIIYSKLLVTQKALPRGSGGGYFAFIKDAGTSNFRSRIFTKTNAAALGKFRLAISNGAFTEQAFPQDLDLNTEYTVITKYDTVNNLATLWVNPGSEQSPSVSGIDFTSTPDLIAYALRQDGGNGSIGVVEVDNLRVGTAWADVFSTSKPFPISLNLAKNPNGTVTLTWSNPDFRLQASADPATGWTNVVGAVSGYTESAATTKFFRLINP